METEKERDNDGPPEDKRDIFQRRNFQLKKKDFLKLCVLSAFFTSFFGVLFFFPRHEMKKRFLDQIHSRVVASNPTDKHNHNKNWGIV